MAIVPEEDSDWPILQRNWNDIARIIDPQERVGFRLTTPSGIGNKAMKTVKLNLVAIGKHSREEVLHQTNIKWSDQNKEAAAFKLKDEMGAAVQAALMVVNGANVPAMMTKLHRHMVIQAGLDPVEYAAKAIMTGSATFIHYRDDILKDEYPSEFEDDEAIIERTILPEMTGYVSDLDTTPKINGTMLWQGYSLTLGAKDLLTYFASNRPLPASVVEGIGPTPIGELIDHPCFKDAPTIMSVRHADEYSFGIDGYDPYVFADASIGDELPDHIKNQVNEWANAA